ncbi:outer membrane lipoprotein Blc [Nocardia farcinica]|uniref:Outer membrane lipoprotein Blc n=1 Tax=Nocardia farcinica TaxID=37329 RepID=A0A449GZ37_NOCFR|nr:lipocalin family protein [Nocardia farcinica]VFA90906.1 outer membrane lipoprotein Blc [Nocardia farcinica]
MSSRTAGWAAGLAGLALAGTVLSGPAANAAPPVPVTSVDLDRYVGRWHQLAAIPQPFNLACARDTTAEYTPLPTGDVGVHNRCTTWTGGIDEIRGTARVNDPVTNAQLHVSFPGVPTQDRLDGPTNYIVTALGPGYSWAVVTDPNRLSGFVLAREPALDESGWAAVRSAIVAAGQNPCFYLTTPTTGGLATLQPLCAR